MQLSVIKLNQSCRLFNFRFAILYGSFNDKDNNNEIVELDVPTDGNTGYFDAKRRLFLFIKLK